MPALKTLIIYYSRTGTTTKVAYALAGALKADVLEIACPRYRLGWFRYLLAGYDSVQGRLPKIDVKPVDLSQYDCIVLAAPIWTSYPALPLRAFIDQNRPFAQPVALALTFGGHSAPEKAVEMVQDLLDAEINNVLTVHQDDVVRSDFVERIEHFADQLQTRRTEPD